MLKNFQPTTDHHVPQDSDDDTQVTAQMMTVSSMHKTTTTSTTPIYRSTCFSWNPVKNWRILLVQCSTVYMPLQMATSTFGLGRNARLLSSTVLPTPSPNYVHYTETIRKLTKRAKTKIMSIKKSLKTSQGVREGSPICVVCTFGSK